jgi:hypothetical protein
MEAEIVSEVLLPLYQTISGPIPEDGSLHIHRRKQRVYGVRFT